MHWLPHRLLELARSRDARLEYYRDRFFRFAHRYTSVVLTERDGLRFFVDTNDGVLGRTVFREGNYEVDQLDSVYETLRAVGIVPSGLFVDVGANIGTTTITVVRRGWATGAVCFEPAPRNFELLRHNIVANGLEELITPHALALSDGDGHAILELSPHNYGDHRVMLTGQPTSAGDNSGVRVPLRSLDSLVNEELLDPAEVGLVWVDAQGHDAHVVAGAEAFRRAGVPFVVEFWPTRLKSTGGFQHYCDVIGQFRVIELGGKETSGLEDLAARYEEPEWAHATLILLPRDGG